MPSAGGARASAVGSDLVAESRDSVKVVSSAGSVDISVMLSPFAQVLCAEHCGMNFGKSFEIYSRNLHNRSGSS